MEQQSSDFKLKKIGNYTITGKTLGKGHFARVEAGYHMILKAQVAVKIISTKEITDEYVRKNYKREAEIMAKIFHPNIICLFETIETTNHYYIISEIGSGGDLCNFIKSQRYGKLDERRARPLAKQLVSAVGYLHKNGIVHRDLKLENILLDDKKENIKIVDFGLSNFYDFNQMLTTHCGSPEYAAPELYIENRNYGPEVDIWSIGIILYGMLVGRLPFYSNQMVQNKEEEKCKQVMFESKSGLTMKHHKSLMELSYGIRTLIPKILKPDPLKRITMNELQMNAWICCTSVHGYVIEDANWKNKVFSNFANYLNQPIAEILQQISDLPYGPIGGLYNIEKCFNANRKLQNGIHVDDDIKRRIYKSSHCHTTMPTKTVPFKTLEKNSDMHRKSSHKSLLLMDKFQLDNFHKTHHQSDNQNNEQQEEFHSNHSNHNVNNSNDNDINKSSFCHSTNSNDTDKNFININSLNLTNKRCNKIIATNNQQCQLKNDVDCVNDCNFNNNFNKTSSSSLTIQQNTIPTNYDNKMKKPSSGSQNSTILKQNSELQQYKEKEKEIQDSVNVNLNQNATKCISNAITNTTTVPIQLKTKSQFTLNSKDNFNYKYNKKNHNANNNNQMKVRKSAGEQQIKTKQQEQGRNIHKNNYVNNCNYIYNENHLINDDNDNDNDYSNNNYNGKKNKIKNKFTSIKMINYFNQKFLRAFQSHAKKSNVKNGNYNILKKYLNLPEKIQNTANTAAVSVLTSLNTTNKTETILDKQVIPKNIHYSNYIYFEPDRMAKISNIYREGLYSRESQKQILNKKDFKNQLELSAKHSKKSKELMQTTNRKNNDAKMANNNCSNDFIKYSKNKKNDLKFNNLQIKNDFDDRQKNNSVKKIYNPKNYFKKIQHSKNQKSFAALMDNKEFKDNNFDFKQNNYDDEISRKNINSNNKGVI